MNFGSPAAAPRRGIILVGLAAAAAVAAFALLASRDTAPPSKRPAGVLGDGSWEIAFDGDCEERSASFSGSRLNLRLATRRAAPAATCFIGARTREPFKIKPGARLSVDVDWNGQANGSGLTAGVAIAPVATTGRPFLLQDFMYVEFIGVPPGKNVRRVVAMREAGTNRHLEHEGWPFQNREGRPISVQRIEIRFDGDGAFRVFENGEQAYAAPKGTLKFDSGYVFLYEASRSNYAPRDVFFDNIVLDPGK